MQYTAGFKRALHTQETHQSCIICASQHITLPHGRACKDWSSLPQCTNAGRASRGESRKFSWPCACREKRAAMYCGFIAICLPELECTLHCILHDCDGARCAWSWGTTCLQSVSKRNVSGICYGSQMTLFDRTTNPRLLQAMGLRQLLHQHIHTSTELLLQPAQCELLPLPRQFERGPLASAQISHVLFLRQYAARRQQLPHARCCRRHLGLRLALQSDQQRGPVCLASHLGRARNGRLAVSMAATYRAAWRLGCCC